MAQEHTAQSEFVRSPELDGAADAIATEAIAALHAMSSAIDARAALVYLAVPDIFGSTSVINCGMGPLVWASAHPP